MVLSVESWRAIPMNMMTMPMNAHKHELTNQTSGLLQKCRWLFMRVWSGLTQIYRPPRTDK